MKTRKEKISFLKGLIRGERSIHEIKPSRQIFLVKRDQGDWFEHSTGKCWTDAQIKLHEAENPLDKVVCVLVKHY
jgi:hypothetical protein